MSGAKPEIVFDLHELFRQINDSFTKAVLELHRTFESKEWVDLPFVYHMPKMNVSMRLSLSYSKGKVKGVFRKVRSQEEQELISTINVEVVAVPRAPSGRQAPVPATPPARDFIGHGPEE